MITEKEKTIIIQTFEPYELHQLGVFKNNTKSIGILYSFQKPCGWDFATLWDDLEEKLNKKLSLLKSNLFVVLILCINKKF